VHGPSFSLLASTATLRCRTGHTDTLLRLEIDPPLHLVCIFPTTKHRSLGDRRRLPARGSRCGSEMSILGQECTSPCAKVTSIATHGSPARSGLRSALDRGFFGPDSCRSRLLVLENYPSHELGCERGSEAFRPFGEREGDGARHCAPRRVTALLLGLLSIPPPTVCFQEPMEHWRPSTRVQDHAHMSTRREMCGTLNTRIKDLRLQTHTPVIPHPFIPLRIIIGIFNTPYRQNRELRHPCMHASQAESLDAASSKRWLGRNLILS